MGFLVKRFRNPVNTYRRAEAVHIAYAVSHDINFILDGNNLAQGMGFYSRFDTGALLHLLALSAIINHIFRHLYYRLIAAAPQSNIYGVSCELIILSVGQAV